MNVRHFVVRENSPTAQRTFWKVLSRGFKEKKDAEHWADYERTLKINKGKTIFIVQMETEY